MSGYTYTDWSFDGTYISFTWEAIVTTDEEN